MKVLIIICSVMVVLSVLSVLASVFVLLKAKYYVQNSIEMYKNIRYNYNEFMGNIMSLRDKLNDDNNKLKTIKERKG